MFEPRQLKKLNRLPPKEQEQQQFLTAKQRQEILAQEVATAKKAIEEERIYRRGVVSIRDLIAPASLEVTSSYIKLEDYFVRTIFVIEYPRYISVGWFAPIINMDITADLAVYFYPVKASIILKQLKKKVLRHSQPLPQRANGIKKATSIWTLTRWTSVLSRLR